MNQGEHTQVGLNSGIARNRILGGNPSDDCAFNGVWDDRLIEMDLSIQST